MKWILKGICFAAVITLVVIGFGFATMHLWNWLMPEIFGLKMISFCQAIGLIILGKILFGGFHKGGRHRHCGPHRGGWGGHRRGEMWKKRWESKMANMTPEQREKLKKEWSKCGWGPNDSDYEPEPKNTEPKI